MKLASFVFVAFACLCLRGEAPELSSRPFRMGFTRWPSDLSAKGAEIAQSFAYKHGDIVSIMFIGGVPWKEALEGKPFSKSVEERLSYRPPEGKKLFLSLCPLDSVRKSMAPYWGEKENMPLPSDWKGKALNSPEVKKAYVYFALKAVERMKPDYLAIGVESNILLSNSKEKWAELLELNSETYNAVKSAYPNLPVFFTTAVLHYKEIAKESKGSGQEAQVAEMMKHSDVFAMSVYPFMSYDVPRPVPEDFFEFARKFGKPIAVSESGDTSKDVYLKAWRLTLKGGEENQRQFTESLLSRAAKDRYLFVINFATTDYEKLCQKLPKPMDDFARIWAYTGMQTSDEAPKPALSAWDAYLGFPYMRHK